MTSHCVSITEQTTAKCYLFVCKWTGGHVLLYVYIVYWLRTASSAFLLAKKCNLLAEIMLITRVIQHAWTQKLQLSSPIVHSLYYDDNITNHFSLSFFQRA